MPNWKKVRANIRPYKDSGFAYLDIPSGDKDWTVVTNAEMIDNTQYTTPFDTAKVMSWWPDPLRYRKTVDGIVYVTGSILFSVDDFSTFNLSVAPWKAVNQGIGDMGHFRLFQLPVGYRPVADEGSNQSWAIPVTERTNNTVGDGAGTGTEGVPELWSLGVDHDGIVYFYAGKIMAGRWTPINFSFYAVA